MGVFVMMLALRANEEFAVSRANTFAPPGEYLMMSGLFRNEKENGIIDETTYDSLNEQCRIIRVMLVASCRTAKQNNASDRPAEKPIEKT